MAKRGLQMAICPQPGCDVRIPYTGGRRPRCPEHGTMITKCPSCGAPITRLPSCAECGARIKD